MKQVRISDLKAHLSEHVRAAETGEVIEVMDRARAVARLVPVERDGALELIPSGRPFSSARRVPHGRAHLTMDSLAALKNERGPR